MVIGKNVVTQDFSVEELIKLFKTINRPTFIDQSIFEMAINSVSKMENGDAWQMLTNSIYPDIGE